MAEFEYRSNYVSDDYRAEVDKKRFEALVMEHQSTRYPVDRLTLDLINKSRVVDGSAVAVPFRKSIIKIPLDDRWEEVRKNKADGQQYFDFILFHELKHIIDLQSPVNRLLRAAYWIGMPQLVYVGMKSFTNHVSPGDPLNNTLSFAVTIGSLYPLYRLDPFERRATRFAKEILQDEANREIITFRHLK